MKEIQIQCPDCRGKGVYQGFAEKQGAAVICHSCNGRGWTMFRYDEFNGIVQTKGIKTVFARNHGFVLTTDSPGGVSYKEWLLDGKKPDESPQEEHKKQLCPGWFHQNTGYGKLPPTKQLGCKGIGSFDGCSNWKNKKKCWDLWDKVNAKKK
jgi:hypothetical protein